MIGEITSARIARDEACAALLPHAEPARMTLEELNDSSIGHVTVVALFDEYLEHRNQNHGGS
ncbi:MAG: hypothetical protein NW216_14845 [Hyphomicrobium sp.]|nr:hypothetical protein [Hyphomicrobium sp.]